MGSPWHVETEAARFLQKLIQDLKYEPTMLAAKLYEMCQHMKMNGKEQSLPYRVISRAMEIIANQHGLDMEVVRSTWVSLPVDPLIWSPSSGMSMDKVASGEHGKRGPKRENKNVISKRKREDSTSSSDVNAENHHQPDTASVGFNHSMGRSTKRSEMQAQINAKGGDHVHNTGNMECISSVPSGVGLPFAVNQEHQILVEKSMGRTQIADTSLVASTSKHVECAVGLQRGGFFPFGHDIVYPRGVWDQYRTGTPSENTPISRFSPKLCNGPTTESSMPQLTHPSVGMSKEALNIGNERKRAIHEYRASGLPGQSSEGATLNKHSKLWQQRVPNSAQMNGEDSLGRESEQRPVRSPMVMNSNISQGSSCDVGMVHGTISEKFSLHGMTKTNFSSRGQFSAGSCDSHEHASEMNTVISLKAASFGQTAVNSKARKHNYSKDETSAIISAGKVLEQDGGISHKAGSTYKMVQGSGSQGSQPDFGKFPISISSGMPFKEQHFKQLRAQILVFLAFRNGLVPGKLHLEIALGENYPKEGGNVDAVSRDANDEKGNVLISKDPTSNSEGTTTFARSGDIREAEKISPGCVSTEDSSSFKEMVNLKRTANQTDPLFDQSGHMEERKCIPAVKIKSEPESLGVAESQGSGSQGSQPDFGKLPISISSDMPFKEQHFKQLRAQILVFLAFRNGLVPGKLHLEIALGEKYPKEAGNADAVSKDLNDEKGNVLTSKDPTSNSKGTTTFASLGDIRESEKIATGCISTDDSLSHKDMENLESTASQTDSLFDQSGHKEERKCLPAVKKKSEPETLGVAESQAPITPNISGVRMKLLESDPSVVSQEQLREEGVQSQDIASGAAALLGGKVVPVKKPSQSALSEEAPVMKTTPLTATESSGSSSQFPALVVHSSPVSEEEDVEFLAKLEKTYGVLFESSRDPLAHKWKLDARREVVSIAKQLHSNPLSEISLEDFDAWIERSHMAKRLGLKIDWLLEVLQNGSEKVVKRESRAKALQKTEQYIKSLEEKIQNLQKQVQVEVKLAEIQRKALSRNDDTSLILLPLA